MRSHLFNILLTNAEYASSNPSILGVQEGTVEQCNNILDILNGRWNLKHNSNSSESYCSSNYNYKMVGQGRSIGNKWGSQIRSWGNELCCIFHNDNIFDLLDYGTFWLSQTPNIPNTISSLAKYPRYNTC